jgi:hypothetical protein
LVLKKNYHFTRNNLYFSLNMGARKTMDGTSNTIPSETGYVDWSETNTGGFIMELTFRATIF